VACRGIVRAATIAEGYIEITVGSEGEMAGIVIELGFIDPKQHA
jgi:hypothetical protein